MASQASSTHTFPDFVVNNFVTEQIKTLTSRPEYQTLRVTFTDVSLADKKLSFCCPTPLSLVSRKGCIVDIVDIIVKSVPKSPDLKDIIPVNKLFAREIYFHETLFPILCDFQNEFNVEERVEAPILKTFSLEQNEEALILQSADFWVPRYDKFEGKLDENQLNTVYRELSRLHAVSFALSKIEPIKAKAFEEQLKDNYLYGFNNKETIKIIQNNLHLTIEKLSEINDDGIVVDGLKTLQENLLQFVEEVIHDMPEFQVLVHGDPSSNFLLGFDIRREQPTLARAKFTNWHLLRFGSPVLDLSILLFTHLENFNNAQVHLESYHYHFGKTLQNFGFEITEEYPLSRFVQDWKKYGKFGLVFAFLILNIDWMSVNDKLNADDTTTEDYINSFTKPPSDEFLESITKITMYCINENLI